MAYRKIKGLTGPKVEKTKIQKYVTLEQLTRILEAVQEDNQKKKDRDHCAIYLGFFLGLRVSEAAILERCTFRHIAAHEAHIRTSKSLPRLPMRCRCGRKWRVSVTRVESHVECPRCGAANRVVKPRQTIDFNPPEKCPPVVETPVVDYIKNYMACVMRPEQRWILESTYGHRISTRQLEIVFGHYAMLAGLDPEYSFHSLRHGRGLLLYERFKDPVMLKESLRQKTMDAAEWYMHLSPERQRQYLDVLDNIGGPHG